MKQTMFLLFFITMVGCEVPSFVDPGPRTIKQERPVVNLPLALRQRNWLGSQGEGSCVWASTISLLRWQGRYGAADWVRQNYGNGEWPDDWAAKMDKAGIRYAYVTNGDVKFLEWAIKTRRGAAVTVMGGKHCVNLVHLDSEWACILDNNDVPNFHWVPRAAFLAEWKNSMGWAFTVLYDPAAPLPQQ